MSQAMDQDKILEATTMRRVGYIKDETGSYPMAMLPIAGVATLGVIALLTIGRGQPRTTPVPAE